MDRLFTLRWQIGRFGEEEANVLVATEEKLAEGKDEAQAAT